MKLYFPKTSILNKIFKKYTINLSCNCLPNIKSIKNAHNKRILNARNNEPKLCNCKKNVIYTFNEKCLLKGVYKETITKGNETKEYTRSTGVSFKTKLISIYTDFNPITAHKLRSLNTSKNSRVTRM